MAHKLSPFWNSWYTWKALRLPWRKQFLAGRDLDGNTYWEFRDLRYGEMPPSKDADGHGPRMRRIVKYPRGTHPGAVVVSPQWHQWLRHVRPQPPSLAEQQQEVARQQQMLVRAAAADARWAGAKRVEGPLEADELNEAGAKPTSTVKEAEPTAAKETTKEAEPAPAAAEPEPVHIHAQPTQQQQQQQRQPPPLPPPPQDDPWKREAQSHGAPGEKWQPAPWAPSPSSKR